MEIIIDTRENQAVISNILNEKNIVEYKFRQLEIGDFLLNNSVVFERKTLKDLILSIKDGRLFRQAYQALKTGQPYIVILEGTSQNIANTGMSREAIQGALVHLTVFMGVPILRSVNLEETINLILLAGKQYEKAEAVDNKRVYFNKFRFGRNDVKKTKLRVLQALPGIGQKRAEILLKEFKTLRNIFSATKTELNSIEGIGKRTANDISRILD